MEYSDLNPGQLYIFDDKTNTYFINIDIDKYDDIFHYGNYSSYLKKVDPDLAGYLRSCIKEIPQKYKLTVKLNLREQIRNKELEEKIINSIRQYFNYKKNRLIAEKRDEKRDIIKYTLFGLGLMFVAYGLQRFLSSIFWLSFLSQGFFVGAWVLLWEVFSFFFFSKKDIREEEKCYDRLINSGYLFRTYPSQEKNDLQTF